ncbi:unnamed protein product [Nippostrongylus brasiliensis]|uniref:HEPN_AbiU2 domain-containing protein n=1 Tax=Nippostrongylus brasiliensis TaxID=27835 RepID=A0A0N4XWG6_NIPBR|nr:unnamed protein product [Nippostrongylus brasiliensis]
MSQYEIVARVEHIKQRLTRNLNAVRNIISYCEIYSQGWVLPADQNAILPFLRTQHQILFDIMAQLQRKLDTATNLHAEAVQVLRNDDVPLDISQEFLNYWEERNGQLIITSGHALLLGLEIRLAELGVYYMAFIRGFVQNM